MWLVSAPRPPTPYERLYAVIWVEAEYQLDCAEVDKGYEMSREDFWEVVQAAVRLDPLLEGLS